MRNLDKLRDINGFILKKNNNKDDNYIKRKLDDGYNKWFEILTKDHEKINHISQRLLYFIDMKVHKKGFQLEDFESEIEKMRGDWYEGYNASNEPWHFDIDGFSVVDDGMISENEAKKHPMYQVTRTLLKRINAKHYGVAKLFEKLGYEVG